MSHSTRIQSLAQELHQFRAVLQEAVSDGGTHQGDALALVKICRGVSLNVWLEAAEENDLTEFLPLPMQTELHPYLVRFLEVLDSYAKRLRVDPETGLADCDAFESMLDLEMERALRNRHSMSLALLHLGLPPAPSEENGQEDTPLTAMAELFSRRIRRYDVAARIGPMEFALLFPGSSMHRMRLLMDRLLAETDKIAAAHGLPRGTVRAGLASIKGRRRISPQEFRKLAEDALAQAQKDKPIVTAAIPDIAATPPGSLVQSYEKLFLFTGR